MLVLSRKDGEKIIIDDNIEIVVLEIQGKRVRLGVRMPDEVNARRGEIPPEVYERHHKPQG